VNKKTQAACTIYHNPRCSKSRATLALLLDRGVAPIVIEHLNTPPSAKELAALLVKLDMHPAELLRSGEEIFKTKVAGQRLTDAQLLAVMVENPILIERPIVVVGDRAVLGRPPENVLTLLD
jgi:arsenate reductase (glutaredoxin)